LMVQQSALLKDQGKTFKKQASMAKYFSSQIAMKISNFAIQIHGGYGYFRDFGIDRYLRDSKLLEIGEGTNEVQRLIIFRELMR
jgi:alkylation response protein AidB-like acyl-CoA dehydrogenase